ncbi:hypothetical protein PFAG_01427 [Plasmodium falciparum Santa Lucia]|uniref:Uncharacterized protein n=4 Tax=Plasmodium falciparum TaxID=5833 RepID=A0A024WVI2_PLAFA|nr:hypothetical protein PFNF135_01572 [Plasmodium falciparum NF135/5.C10]ETW50476.1 hypothetical protein PFMALIP_01492 [Plasmodium falciparum MaliPS096_E11]EUT89277.1 hypothetical protein PFAG_01427 [Plasmodium falciparum Santa Lucia]EWC77771.1 hypothetical protein C923_01557 [Plasmodium falciparum UGT5.1]
MYIYIFKSHLKDIYFNYKKDFYFLKNKTSINIYLKIIVSSISQYVLRTFGFSNIYRLNGLYQNMFISVYYFPNKQ